MPISKTKAGEYFLWKDEMTTHRIIYHRSPIMFSEVFEIIFLRKTWKKRFHKKILKKTKNRSRVLSGRPIIHEKLN